MEETIGTLKWAAYENSTSRLLSGGEKILHLSDVVIKPIKDLFDKRIDLGDGFTFGLVASTGHEKGFALSGLRGEQETFSWEWFTVDQPGHATKLQESGELSFDTKKSPNGIEINRMELLTDVSIRIVRRTDPEPFPPVYRLNILKGTIITWPALANGHIG